MLLVKRWPLVAGAILGVLAWGYDHDFLLNAGGTETRRTPARWC